MDSKQKYCEIDWLDTMAERGWIKKIESINNAKIENAMLHHSVGFLLEDNNDYILICQSINHSQEIISESLQIPKVSIVRKKERLWSVS